MNQLITQIKNDIKNCENKNNHIKRYQSLICNLCNESFNDNILRGTSTKLNQLMNEFVKDFYKFTNMKSSGSNNDKKIKTISYKDIPYQVIFSEILEFYLVSYSDIFDEYVRNAITYAKTPFIKIKKFIDTLRTEWKGDFRLNNEHVYIKDIHIQEYYDVNHYKTKIKFLEDTINSNEFKDYKLLVIIINKYLINRNENFLKEIHDSIINDFENLDLFGLFPSFYGYFKKDRTRKRFPIFKNLRYTFYKIITLNLFNVNKIKLTEYLLENNSSYSEYLFIPNGVRYLNLNYRNNPYKFFGPYFSRFKNLVSLINFMGFVQKISILIEILQEHSPKLKKLGLIYVNELYDKITIFEKQLDKLEYLSVHIKPYLTPIKFDTDTMSKLKTFQFLVTGSELEDFSPSGDMISKLKNCEHLIFENFLILPTHVNEIWTLTNLNELTLRECELFTKINKTTVFALLFQLPYIKYLNIINRYIDIDIDKLNMIDQIKVTTLGINLKRVKIYDLRDVVQYARLYERRKIIEDFYQKLKNRNIKIKYTLVYQQN
jgi:hypothetical protein